MADQLTRRKLDYHYKLVFRTILRHQDPITGLIPSHDNHAYIRDNTYAVIAVWSLMLASKKSADTDEETARMKDLEGRVVKCMRSLLSCMMRQADKVEKFKKSRRPIDALHCKFASDSLLPVTTDGNYGHLQIDAVSLYLLTLAQITASGLALIYTPEEVAFIQNLVFYIEEAYVTCDYGIWERGDKTNHGLPELNSTSVGMARAALEAIAQINLFGTSGASSFIHVMSDDPQSCAAVLETMLPRESLSKETDAGLLSVISYPAFAVDSDEVVNATRETIVEKLAGSFGCCRFLRDGYKTALEDPTRLHYEPWELKMFENVECEWPLFFCYLLLDALFNKQAEVVEQYSNRLKDLVRDDHGFPVVPELFAVRKEDVTKEYAQPKSQERIPLGCLPHMWSQSLYTVCRILMDNILRPQELDPVGRRLCMEPKPDLVVQVAVLVENESLLAKLQAAGMRAQSFRQLEEDGTVKVFPAKVLVELYKELGKCPKLGLSGRSASEVGILATSRLYSIGDELLAFTPQYLDQQSFYLSLDVDFMMDRFTSDVAFLRVAWSSTGRPLFILPVFESYKESESVFQTLKKLQTGLVNNTRVILSTVKDFLDTSCVSKLSFLKPKKVEELTQSLRKQGVSYRRRRRSRLGSLAGQDTSMRAAKFAALTRRRKSMAISAAVSLELGETCREDEDFPSSPPPVVGQLRIPHVDSSNGIESMRRIVTRSLTPSDSSNSLQNLEQGDDILDKLRESDDLYEQCDLLTQLAQVKGMDFDTQWKGKMGITVRELIREIYVMAGSLRQWWLVRYTAGLLGKRVEELSKCVMELLIRLKQVTVGMDTETVINSPRSTTEIGSLIDQACQFDRTLGILTQEILVYMSMFAKSEPQLLQNMYRIRVGLIIKVMASELARSLHFDADKATEHLLGLSPYEMKTLLGHILSGTEFCTTLNAGRSVFVNSCKHSLKEHGLDEKMGQWLRRRKIDGALNRVPPNFYTKMWQLIERSEAVEIHNSLISQSVTREMTEGEVKFALLVDDILTKVPVPEFRQLVVEALSLLIRIPELDPQRSINLHWVVPVEKIVRAANEIFLQEQARLTDGDAAACCAGKNPQQRLHAGKLACGGANGICLHFYDTAPGGRYGTMMYMSRAVTQIVPLPSDGEGKVEMDCCLQ